MIAEGKKENKYVLVLAASWMNLKFCPWVEIEAKEILSCGIEIRLLINIVTLATSLLCFSEGQFKLLSISRREYEITIRDRLHRLLVL